MTLHGPTSLTSSSWWRDGFIQHRLYVEVSKWGAGQGLSQATSFTRPRYDASSSQRPQNGRTTKGRAMRRRSGEGLGLSPHSSTVRKLFSSHHEDSWRKMLPTRTPSLNPSRTYPAAISIRPRRSRKSCRCAPKLPGASTASVSSDMASSTKELECYARALWEGELLE